MAVASECVLTVMNKLAGNRLDTYELITEDRGNMKAGACLPSHGRSCLLRRRD